MSLTVVIDGVDYDIEDLTGIVRWSEALDEAGVDNWEGYNVHAHFTLNWGFIGSPNPRSFTSSPSACLGFVWSIGHVANLKAFGKDNYFTFW